MTPRALSVGDYDFQPEDELFLDANIWLFIYGSQNPGDARMRVYSSAFRRILEAGSRIYIDVLIVSEFINAYARLQWQIRAPDSRFKAFRNGPDFREVAQEIADNVRRVLSHCSRIESHFDTLDADELMDEYAQGGADFNDQVIRNLCRSRNLKLITDDRDFNGQGISILTANRRLLG